MGIYILGIESSCDDTSAAITCDTIVLSNITAGQDIHRQFGGVVPEYASRAHQQNIIPVIDSCLQQAKIQKNDIQAVAFTRGPGLLGSLIVGSSFAKAFALGMNIPLIEVDHIHAHILCHFIKRNNETVQQPEFPYLCLVVSGGHTQITLVNSHFEMDNIGRTIDDAAGEAFDKAAKIMGLPYPGGVHIDRYAALGNPRAFSFPEPSVPGLDFSFSGLKTSFLYFIRDRIKENPLFIDENLNDLCASIQYSIVSVLIRKLEKASLESGVKQIAISGGVSANSMFRETIIETGKKLDWKVYIPDMEFTTDNAAMIAVLGYFKFVNESFSNQSAIPYARIN